MKEEERKRHTPMMQPVNNQTMASYASKIQQNQQDNTQKLNEKLEAMGNRDVQINCKIDELIRQRSQQEDERRNQQMKDMQKQIEDLRQANQSLKDELKRFKDNYEQTHSYHKLKEEIGCLRKEVFASRKTMEKQFEWLVQDIHWLMAYLSGNTSKETLKLVHRQRVIGFEFESIINQSSPQVPQLTDLVSKIRWECTRPRQQQSNTEDVSFMKS